MSTPDQPWPRPGGAADVPPTAGAPSIHPSAYPVPPTGYAAPPAGAPAPGTQPAYGAPAYGYGQPSPYAYQPPPSNGALAWALGFLIFIPVLGFIAAGIAMACSYGPLSRRGDVARENARSALNWGLTFMIVQIVMLILHVTLLFALAGGEGTRSFYPIGIPITIFAVVGLLHIVLTIVGTVRASSGEVMKVPIAIPFVRR